MASNDEYQQRQFFEESKLLQLMKKFGNRYIQEKIKFYNDVYDALKVRLNKVIIKHREEQIPKNPEDLSLIQDIPEDDTLHNKE